MMRKSFILFALLFASVSWSQSLSFSLRLPRANYDLSEGSICQVILSPVPISSSSSVDDFFSPSSETSFDPYSVPSGSYIWQTIADFYTAGTNWALTYGRSISQDELSATPYVYCRVFSATNLDSSTQSLCYLTTSKNPGWPPQNLSWTGSQRPYPFFTLGDIDFAPVPAGSGGADGDEFPVDSLVSSFSAVGLSILPKIVLVGLGFFALLALSLGIRYLLRASRRVR